jgi:CO/xanthine dehydrogenase Mo-binding subunit
MAVAPGPVGQSVPRVDGVAKVTGAARYLDDLDVPGAWHGVTVRSTIPHGIFEGLDLDPAFDWSAVVVVTADQLAWGAGLAAGGLGDNYVAMIDRDQPALVPPGGRITHADEPVALIAAPTKALAAAARRAARPRQRPLPPVLTIDDALAAEIKLYGDDNIFKQFLIRKGHGDDDEFDAAMAGAAQIIDGTYHTGAQEQMYIEPQAMAAWKDGALHVAGSMQCPYYVHKALKRVLGHADFNVVQAVTGGGFGGKEEYPSLVAIHAALLALKTGRPVKLIYRRDEDLRATTKRHPMRARYRTLVDEGTGRLLAAEAELLFDGGAYNTLSPVVNSRGAIHALGPYRCDHAVIDALMVATHTPPNGAFRGFGAPQAHWSAERHIDRIARVLGLDPLAVRRTNMYRDGDRTPTGQVLRDVGIGIVLERALERAEKPLPPRLAATRPGGGGPAARLVPSRGLALAWHGCGFTGNGEAALKGKADVALEGRDVVIYIASTDIGQGPETIFPQIVAETLGLPLARVRNAPHDTAQVPDSGPTVASRTTMVVGGVAQKAARKLRDALAAEVGFDGDFDRMLAARKSAANLRVQAEYTDDCSLVWDPKTYQGDAYPAFGWACVIVDLDVDADTGEVFYRRLVQATDVGRAINPVLCSGQLEGGALQALGFATSEELVLDAQHGMRNNRLTNYIIPTALDAPEMETVLVEIPFAGGPFGAKGIGEIPHDVPHAAVAQAIERATGAVLDRLPMTPERVLAALDTAAEPSA